MTLLVVLALLAVWRLARLVSTDVIFDSFRRRAAGSAPDGDTGDGDDLRPRIGYLLTCPWCISVWIAPAVMVPVAWWPDNRAVFAVCASLAASGVAGLLAVVEGAMGRRDD